MYNMKRPVYVPDDPFDAVHILNKELMPHLDLNPESWGLVEGYIAEMGRKFKPEELKVLEFCEKNNIRF